MDQILDAEITHIIDAMSVGQLKYTEKQATKKGWNSAYDFLLSKRKEKEELRAKGAFLKSFNYVYNNKDLPTELDFVNTLKAYGASNPFSINRGSLDDVRTLTTLSNLFFMISRGTNSGLPIYTEYFLKHENLITNNEMFWTLCPPHWCITTIGFSEKVFNRYERQKVPLERRLACVQLFTHKWVETDKTVNTLDFQMSRLNEYDDDELIVPIFRVFKVAKGKAIRKSIVKAHPEAHIHEEGSSWSYSFLKGATINIGTYLNRHLIKKYADVTSDDDVERVLRDVYAVDTGFNKNDAVLYDGFYQCVGVFGAKKEHIEFCTDYWGEDELVINPKNVDLIDYRFLNILDWVASRWLRDMLDLSKVHGINRSGIIGMDGMFDLYRIVAKKFLDENPERFKQVLRNWNPSTSWLRMRQDLIGFQEVLCGNKLRYENHQIIDGTKFVTAMVGDVALERFNEGVRQRTSIPKKYLNP